MSADAQLLRTLHDQHAAALSTFVAGLVGGDRAKAQDVVQETFLRAWRSPEVLESANGSVRGWLFTVARRIVIDQWRSDSRRPELVTDSPPEPTTTDDDAERVVDRQVVVTALRSLSEEHRRVLVESYFFGSTLEQTAKTLGVPVGTVKSRTHYALRAMRAILAEMGSVR